MGSGVVSMTLPPLVFFFFEDVAVTEGASGMGWSAEAAAALLP